MKKIIAILLVVSTIFGLCVGLTGCGKDDPSATDPINPPTSTTPNTPSDDNKNTNETLSKFNVSLIKYVDENVAEGENYMISPLSLRYALALATTGANEETKEGLLKATGFKSTEDYIAWCESVNLMVEKFDENLKEEKERFEKNFGKYDDVIAPDRKLVVANSIWHNDGFGILKQEYLQQAKEVFDAEVQSISLDEFVSKINAWVNEKTNGLIPELFSDALEPDVNTILINTLYLKSGWSSTFNEYNTKEKDFTTYNGEKVKKEFMNQEEEFLYYENDDLQVVIIPLEGNINVAFAIGDTTNLASALSEAKTELVNVTIPKFEIETTLENGILCEFLKANGANEAFSKEGSDFSNMIEGAKIYIADIIQKTKIKVDEDGLEAAAVTAIVTDGITALPSEPPQPKIFNADKPFSFYIYGDGELPKELLFYGEMNK